MRLYATPLINHLNQQTGWLASMYNITELKKARSHRPGAPAFSHRAQRPGCGGVRQPL